MDAGWRKDIHAKIAVLYQAVDTPIYDGVSKPRKPGGPPLLPMRSSPSSRVKAAT